MALQTPTIPVACEEKRFLLRIASRSLQAWNIETAPISLFTLDIDIPPKSFVVRRSSSSFPPPSPPPGKGGGRRDGARIKIDSGGGGGRRCNVQQKALDGEVGPAFERGRRVRNLD